MVTIILELCVCTFTAHAFNAQYTCIIGYNKIILTFFLDETIQELEFLATSDDGDC